MALRWRFARPIPGLGQYPFLGVRLGLKISNMGIGPIPCFDGHKPTSTLHHFRFKLGECLHHRLNERLTSDAADYGPFLSQQ